MRINDVEKIVGLTQKAIRLYESGELVKIARDDMSVLVNFTKEEAAVGVALKL